MSENEKQLQDLLVAVTTLEKTQETTTKNVDKIVTHLERLLPIHTDIANLKKTIYAAIAIFIGYASWNTIEYHRIDNELQVTKAVQKEKDEEVKKNYNGLLEKSNSNKNQITYIKGRVTGIERKNTTPSTYINAGNGSNK